MNWLFVLTSWETMLRPFKHIEDFWTIIRILLPHGIIWETLTRKKKNSRMRLRPMNIVLQLMTAFLLHTSIWGMHS
ncbi:hypothetical protein D3C77_773490 [compost metagenome]